MFGEYLDTSSWTVIDMHGLLPLLNTYRIQR